MSRIHESYADSTYQSPSSAKRENWKPEDVPWGMGEPPREMHAISPTLLHAGTKQPSPGFAQGRWSHHTGGTSEQGTPLRSSFQRDDVGPGPAQVKDPNLHEQYFGVGDDPDEVSGPSNIGVAHEFYPTEAQRGHGQLREDERGHFI